MLLVRCRMSRCPHCKEPNAVTGLHACYHPVCASCKAEHSVRLDCNLNFKEERVNTNTFTQIYNEGCPSRSAIKQSHLFVAGSGYHFCQHCGLSKPGPVKETFPDHDITCGGIS